VKPRAIVKRSGKDFASGLKEGRNGQRH
jgi:hypothetical protein